MRIVAVDTETVREAPWSVQLSADDYPFGEMYYCDTPSDMAAVQGSLEAHNALTVLHNAKFDLRVLAQVGVHPWRCECTMQMAYLIGEPVLSLKVLAYRIAGIEMRTFKEVTAKATRIRAERYLNTALESEWPDPDPTMNIDKDGNVKFSFPQNIHGKIKRLLAKCEKDPTIDLYTKWNDTDIDIGRGQVEAVLGKMQMAYLDEVEKGEAEEYAKLDAEATLAIYPYLHDRIQELELQAVLERDMACIPMVMAMEDNGITLDVGVLEELGVELQLGALVGTLRVTINIIFTR